MKILDKISMTEIMEYLSGMKYEDASGERVPAISDITLEPPIPGQKNRWAIITANFGYVRCSLWCLKGTRTHLGRPPYVLVGNNESVTDNISIRAVILKKKAIDLLILNALNERLMNGRIFLDEFDNVIFGEEILLSGGISESLFFYRLTAWKEELGRCKDFIKEMQRKTDEVQRCLDSIFKRPDC